VSESRRRAGAPPAFRKVRADGTGKSSYIANVERLMRAGRPRSDVIAWTASLTFGASLLSHLVRSGGRTDRRIALRGASVHDHGCNEPGQEAWDVQEAGGVTEEQKYVRAWRRLSLIRWSVALWFLAYLPIMAVLSLRFPTVPGQYFFFGYAAVFLAGMALLSNFRCPKCGKPFAISFGWNNALTSKCLHCGIHVRERPISN